jgi:hypothetical protein
MSRQSLTCIDQGSTNQSDSQEMEIRAVQGNEKNRTIRFRFSSPSVKDSSDDDDGKDDDNGRW